MFVVLAVGLASCDWSQGGFGPARTGNAVGESTIGVGNVSQLTLKFVGVTAGTVSGSPAVVGGVVYVSDSSGTLSAFDASGNTGCSGTPKTCQPLWTASTGSFSASSSPAVVNGVVYLGSQGRLSAFDASGVTGCSGTPKTCQPLWTAATAAASGSPTVSNGAVLVSAGPLYAFDAAGTTGCSGTPKTCTPLWTSNLTVTSTRPAAQNGVVYAMSDAPLGMYAWDAAGVTGCAGAPKVCAPLWSGPLLGENFGFSSPTVANGLVYVNGGQSGGTGSPPPRQPFLAFDAAGTRNCSGSPKTCRPVYADYTPPGAASNLAAAGGFVYGMADGIVRNATAYLFAYTKTPIPGKCSFDGIYYYCPPAWTAPHIFSPVGSPAVANGVVYISDYLLQGIVTPTINRARLLAFDAAGKINCSGTPVECNSLWTVDVGQPIDQSQFWDWSPSVADGRVYVGSRDGVHVFGLP